LEIKIIDDCRISLNIEVEIEEWLHIDEFRIVCLASPSYKAWVQDFRQGDFPCASKDWQGPQWMMPSFFGGGKISCGRSLPAFFGIKMSR